MTGKLHKVSNKTLTFILVILFIIIITIASIIFLISQKQKINEQILVDIGRASNNALEINNDILDRVTREPDYAISDAENDFESAIRNGDSVEKIYISIYYSRFLFSIYDDIDRATKVLLKNEPLATANDDLRIDYYVALRDLYEEAGEDDKVNYYDQLISELVPDGIFRQEGIETDE